MKLEDIKKEFYDEFGYIFPDELEEYGRYIWNFFLPHLKPTKDSREYSCVYCNAPGDIKYDDGVGWVCKNCDKDSGESRNAVTGCEETLFEAKQDEQEPTVGVARCIKCGHKIRIALPLIEQMYKNFKSKALKTKQKEAKE